jgi:hypothetical protein
MKFKKCCRREDEIGPPDPGPVSQGVKDSTDRMMEEEGYTHEAALKLREKKRKRRSLIPAALFGMAMQFSSEGR